MGKSVGDLLQDFMYQTAIAASPGGAEIVFLDIPSHEVAGALRIAANDVNLGAGRQLFYRLYDTAQNGTVSPIAAGVITNQK